MELTPEEQGFLRPYLAMKVGEEKRWVAGVLLGLLICAVGVCLRFSHVGPDVGPYFLLILVIGMVVIEMAIGHRDKARLGRILQKYDAAARAGAAPAEQGTA